MQAHISRKRSIVSRAEDGAHGQILMQGREWAAPPLNYRWGAVAGASVSKSQAVAGAVSGDEALFAGSGKDTGQRVPRRTSAIKDQTGCQQTTTH